MQRMDVEGQEKTREGGDLTTFSVWFCDVRKSVMHSAILQLRTIKYDKNKDRFL